LKGDENMPKEAPKIKVNFVPAEPWDLDDVCFCFFGMNADALVRDIARNKDGKYDRVFAYPTNKEVNHNE